MKLGLFLASSYQREIDPDRQVAEQVELVRLAAELGFDVLSCGQHYLTSDLRCFQPISYLTYLSTFAPGLRVATGILSLPLLNPTDVAEQLATLDVLSAGRAVLGVGLGYRAEEFAAFGVARDGRVERLTEAIGLIRAIWSGDRIDHHGRYFDCVAEGPSVAPTKPGGPPIWVGAQSRPGVVRAAALGDAWYAPPFVDAPQLAELAELFAGERDRLGLPAAAEFPVRRDVVIGRSRRTALAGAEARSRRRLGLYGSWGLQRDLPSAADQQAAAAVSTPFVAGTAEECAAELNELREQVNASHIVIRPQWPDLPHSEALEQLELFGCAVQPLLG